MYIPDNENNSGWDRLIVMEAFPHSKRSRSTRRFIIPVFIQNTFSSVDASNLITISESDVTTAHRNCLDNTTSRVQSARHFHFLSAKNQWVSISSRPCETNFVLLLLAKCNQRMNTITNSPPNVMFC